MNSFLLKNKNHWDNFWQWFMRNLFGCMKILKQRFRPEYIAYSFSVFVTFSSLSLSLIQKIHHYDFSLILLFRGILVSSAFYTAGRASNSIVYLKSSKNFYLMVIQMFITSTNMGLQYYLVLQIPISVIFITQNTGPIFVFIFNYFSFGEKITKYEIAGIIIAFSGICLIMNSQSKHSLISHSGQEYAEGKSFVFIVCLLLTSTATWAYSLILIRQMDKMDNFQNSFNEGIGFIIFGAFAMLTRQVNYSHFVFNDYLVILFMSFLGVLSQAFFFGAQFLAPKYSGHITLFQYLAVIWSFIYEYFIFNEQPQFLIIVGSLMVLCGIIFILKEKIQ